MVRKAKTYLIRIKRFGNQWATCGVGIMPPNGRESEDGIWDICPKLVPGQVVELPEDHDLITDPNTGDMNELIEIVQRPAKDEIIRPWVFKSSEDAILADPVRGNRNIDEIRAGLAMTQSAIENAPKHRKKARKEREDAEPEDEDAENFEEGEDEDGPGADYEPTPNNKNLPLDDTEDDEPAPRAPRSRRRR